MDNLYIEVVLKDTSLVIGNKVVTECVKFFYSNNSKPSEIVSKFNKDTEKFLHENVQYLVIGEFHKIEPIKQLLEKNCVELSWYVYTLDKTGPQNQNYEDSNGESITLSTHYLLPSANIHGLWESLIFDNNIKSQLLEFAKSLMVFSRSGVDQNTISCNRVILLHGPPGTGKTSLCKALAHKLSIKMQETYKRTVLLEINSHSLFSRWFSESGKLVTRMFLQIIEILQDQNILVCVLIDEVESLAHARTQCMSGTEPSDSIRAVNSLLTEIDKLKNYPNVLILATSNLTSSIDIAFIDRADIKQYIGPPTSKAIYQILLSTINELIKAKIISPAINLISNASYFSAAGGNVEQRNNDPQINVQLSKDLLNLSKKCEGLSGRSLRKLPIIAHALFLKSDLKIASSQITVKDFLKALESAYEFEKNERKRFGKNFNVEMLED